METVPLSIPFISARLHMTFSRQSRRLVAEARCLVISYKQVRFCISCSWGKEFWLFSVFIAFYSYESIDRHSLKWYSVQRVEEWPSGWRRRSWKPLYESTVGSNPTSSAIFFWRDDRAGRWCSPAKRVWGLYSTEGSNPSLSAICFIMPIGFSNRHFFLSGEPLFLFSYAVAVIYCSFHFFLPGPFCI